MAQPLRALFALAKYWNSVPTNNQCWAAHTSLAAFPGTYRLTHGHTHVHTHTHTHTINLFFVLNVVISICSKYRIGHWLCRECWAGELALVLAACCFGWASRGSPGELPWLWGWRSPGNLTNLATIQVQNQDYELAPGNIHGMSELLKHVKGPVL